MFRSEPSAGKLPEDSSLARFGRWGIGHLLAILVVTTVIALVLAGLAMVQSVSEAGREDYRRALHDHAEALATGVDMQFDLVETALGTLSESDALARGDLDAFEAEMRRVSARLGGPAIILAGPDGGIEINTMLPPGERRPGMVGPFTMLAMTTGATQISDLTIGRVSGLKIAVLAVPVLRGQPEGNPLPIQRALAAGLTAERFTRLLVEPRLPETQGLRLVIADRVGNVIARSGQGADAETATNAGVLTRLRPIEPGSLVAETEVEGRVKIEATAPDSGFKVALSVPTDAFRAPLLRARWRTVGLGVAVLGLSLGLALLLGKRLRRELRRLAAADAATDPTVGVRRTGLREVDVLAAALARTRRERDRATAELRTLFAVSPIGLAHADLGGRVQDANEAFLALVGLGAAELAAGEVRWDELTPPELLPRDERAIAEAVRTGRCTPYEKAFQRADGTRVPVLVSLALLDRATGECAVFAVDLTERKRTEAALAESEAGLARALAAAEMASWDWDMETGTVIGSPGREALYGCEPGELDTGTKLLAAVHPDDRAAMRMAMERALDPNSDGTYEHEFQVPWRDGTVRWLHSRGGATRRRADGRVLHMSGVVRDISALKESQERRELLVREVDHRAKNVLAVVQAVLKLTRADDPKQYARTVEGRIAALAKAHTLLSRQRWAGADLRALVAEELAAFGSGDGEPTNGSPARLRLDGPSVFLSPWAVQPLSMALHELATNAAKYGALASAGGRLEVRWSLAPADGALAIDWHEHGCAVPPVPPTRKGFGTRVIDGAVGDQLGGKLERQWRPGGLACRIILPADRVAGELGPRRVEPRPPLLPVPMGIWSGRRVLVVEDDALIAQGLVEALNELGIEVVGPASTLEQALGLAATAPSLDAAVLDINLAGRLSLPVADVLAGRGVPMVFASGYGSLPRESLPERHRGRPLLMKPVKAEAIVAALTRHAGVAFEPPLVVAPV